MRRPRVRDAERSQHEDRVDWTDIGWQVNYEENFVPEPHIGPFAFSRLSYEVTLTDALHRYKELASC